MSTESDGLPSTSVVMKPGTPEKSSDQKKNADKPYIPISDNKYYTKKPWGTNNRWMIKFKCKICDFETLYRNDLKKHEVAVHSTHVFKYAYKCDECDFVTDYKHNFYQHKSRHITAKRKRLESDNNRMMHGAPYGGGASAMKRAKNEEPEEQAVTVKCEFEELETVPVLENEVVRDVEDTVKIENVEE